MCIRDRLNKWQSYLSEELCKSSKFNVDKINEAISLCIDINSENEITNWSFQLTKVKCSLIVENKHIDALLTRKSNTRITSRILKPIKDYVEDLDKIIEISKVFRSEQLLSGKIEIPKPNNNIKSLEELLVHNPVDYSKEYLEQFDNNDIQTYISPLLHKANLIWLFGLGISIFPFNKCSLLNTLEISIILSKSSM